MESNYKVRTVQSIAKDVEQGKISFTHKLQRKEGVWNKQQQSELIDSLLRPYPINAAYAIKEGETIYIIDGVQRLSTICNYVANKFSLSKNMDIKDANGEVIPLIVNNEVKTIAGKKFKKQDDDVKEAILNTDIHFYLLSDWTEADIREIFKRQNAGKSLSNGQLRVVKESDEASNIIRELASYDFIQKTLGASAVKKDEDKETIRKTLMLTSDFESKTFRNENLNNFILYYNKNIDKSQIDILKKALNSLDGKFTDVKIQRNSVPFVLYGAFETIRLKKSMQKYCVWANDFIKNYMNIPEYAQYCSRGATSIDKVEGKLNYIKKHISQLK